MFSCHDRRLVVDVFFFTHSFIVESDGVFWEERSKDSVKCAILWRLCIQEYPELFMKIIQFFFSIFVRVLASDGTLLKLQFFPCSLSSAAVFQQLDLKQPQVELWLKTQQMTICNPHTDMSYTSISALPQELWMTACCVSRQWSNCRQLTKQTLLTASKFGGSPENSIPYLYLIFLFIWLFIVISARHQNRGYNP